ncbi:MAG: PAS domain-containing protein [Opitutales bacterium]|nr:PAS domain-containing protein [Opitutales bacterium]
MKDSVKSTDRKSPPPVNEAGEGDGTRTFAAFIKHLPGITFIKDAAGRYTFANGGWEKLFDRSAEDSLGLTDFDLFPEEMARAFTANDALIQQSGEARIVYEDVLTESGRQHMLVSKFPIFDAGGKVAHVGGVAVDVTTSRRAELELKEREEQLREAHERIRFHIVNSPLAVVEWDEEFRVIRWSGQAENIFGWTEAEVRGFHPDDWAFVHPDDRESVAEIMRQLSKGEKPRNLSHNRNLTKDGSVRFCDWYNSVSLGDNGRVQSIFSLVDDVTDRVRAQKEIVRLNTQLERRVERRTAELRAANAELEAFAYSVSHDLRAPLRAIAGFAMALAEHVEGGLDDSARKYLERIQSRATRMGELIDDLLQLSRLTRTKMKIEHLDLTSLAEEVAAETAQANPEHSVVTVIAPGMKAEGDPSLVRVLLQNLLANAWKFTRNSTEARIEVGVRREGGLDTFFVRDNGVGFDMRYVHKLFTAFQRLHSQAEYPGHGVGLATVQRVVRRHGGSARAESGAGAGATFFFTLSPRPAGESRKEP